MSFKITSFKRPPYEFLSNFYLVEIELDGDIYPSVEHAYQAAKLTDSAEREPFQRTITGFFDNFIPVDLSAPEAKRAGRKIESDGRARKDWPEIKQAVMLDLLRKKFEHKHLRKMLLDTGDAELVEGNWWGDTYWGVCNGKGENHLGKLLMQVREEIRKG